MSTLQLLYNDLKDALSTRAAISLRTLGTKHLEEALPEVVARGHDEFRLEGVKKERPPPKLLREIFGEPEQARGSGSAQQVGEDLGVRIRVEEEELPDERPEPPPVTIFVETRDKQGALRRLRRKYGTELERVVFKGTFGNGLRIQGTAWQSERGVELCTRISGFQEPTLDFFNGYFRHPYLGELTNVALSDHELVASTADMRIQTRYARVKAKRGILFHCTLTMPPHLAALVDVPTEGKKLTLFGWLPHDADETVKFFTAPLFKLKVGSLQLERGYFKATCGEGLIDGERSVPDEDDDGYREVKFELYGLKTLGSQERLFYGDVPAEHESLQLRMSTSMKKDSAVPVAELDALMGGNSFWRDVLPASWRPTTAKVRRYNQNTQLSDGLTASTLCELRIGNLVTRDGRLRFARISLRWVVGFPDDPSLTNVFVEGEAKLHYFREGTNVFDEPLDASISFTPAHAITALREAMPAEAYTEMWRTLGRQDPPVVRRPMHVRFRIAQGGITLESWTAQ
ncbi:hypothetical protein [Pyxidicoccus sp. MSG2]|uniref:hypothetical protein n=1 Tax=Pyxidicoccus sp. MSG2 TaxID=2996790 RepID=UPI00226DBA78|nr:hypothetical protein [Pyxidicoccus sp. MSG2]MCY1018181.1 hypothetical protein [Pyxidicoccus sp. MSG2]